MSLATVISPDGKHIEMWDNTKLKAYACTERGRLGYEEHLVPLEPSEGLSFGEGFHAAVEAWTKARLAGASDPEAIERGIQAFVEVWNRMIPEDRRFMLETSGDRRSVENFKRLFGFYRKQLPLENFDEIVAVEQPFTILLGTTPAGVEVYWSGIIDRIVRWMDGLYCRDIKTTSKTINERLFDEYKLSGQLKGYQWVSSQLGFGAMEGIGVEVVKVEAPLKTKTRAANELIQSEVIPFAPEQLDAWRQNTLQRIDRVLQVRCEGSYTLDDGDLCTMYDGCEFRHICWAMPGSKDSIKDERYRQKVWSPFDRLGLTVGLEVIDGTANNGK
jgi:hypothetical protein